MPTSSPALVDNKAYEIVVYVAESKKNWLDGIYAADMATAFLEADSANFKRLHLSSQSTFFMCLEEHCTHYPARPMESLEKFH